MMSKSFQDSSASWRRFSVAYCLFALLTTALLGITTATSNTTVDQWSDLSAQDEIAIEGFFSDSGHTNNWAVLVCTSRFWFNYRHIANTLSIYHTVKRLGIPDSNIILMLADDVACNARNHFPATVFNNAGRFMDLYGRNVEVDYRGYDVTVENFIRLLTGRHDPQVPRNKRLLTDDRSNILVYMTGHGGDEFLKFQDAEEISSHDVADAFGQMFEKNRYHEMFFMIDTCQAASMYKQIYSPNILAAASALVKQNSYSHHVDPEIGVAVIDRFTYYNLEVLEKLGTEDQYNLEQLFNTYESKAIASTPGIRTDLYPRGVSNTRVTDFFGGVQNVQLTLSRYALDGNKTVKTPALIERNPSPRRNDPLTDFRVAPSRSRLLKASESSPISVMFVAVTAVLACALWLQSTMK